MGEVYISRKGGSNPLNFNVIGGTSAPSNPNANAIWINTSTAVTDWVFQATQPSGAEGRVWIKTSTVSAGVFNALKKNSLYIYPAEAKQYVNGAWVSKAMKIYQNGTWKSMEMYLYNYDKMGYTWTSEGKLMSADAGGDKSAPTITDGSGGVLNIRQPKTYSCGIAYISQKIDLTNYKTLTFSGVISADTDHTWRARLYIWSALGTYANDNSAAMKQANVNGTTTIDISSLSGSYYIGFAVHHSDSVIDVNYIKLSA